ncbi:2-oxo acid dehydrogenase subunit E2 [Tessaracoccus rhinocerotis]|uniref:Dihydrolipoamide acetyltransferase component of pyruvate dehydrogenase complex n=1 Tax=Tessaracoccus rhinocerotis TaxID=1689449 RepID=A0A553K640_9ACTN|nr:dihydrolipoamide acetyltransferase family protein [Tessaracoccus rhinocerotis]TRY20166.1 2-oxo acid dehydrogenase subunit E2 [Tessaracoccus rhinocerotis]
MASIVVMPQLGNSVESCLIVSWAVSEGDSVAENTVLCEVETDKASMEVPSTAAGTVLKLLWAEGDDVPVKDPLVVVGEPGEDPEPALREAGFGAGESTEAADGEAGYEETDARPASGAEPVETLDKAPEPTPAAPAGGSSIERGVSPRARNLAASKSLDTDAIADGTGPGGRVIERDVEAALAAGPEATRAAARDGGAGRADAVGTGLGGRVSSADLAAATESAPEASAASVAQPAATASGDFPGAVTETPVKGIRKVISERMMASLAGSAQLTYNTTANAQGLLDLRKKFKNSDPAIGMNGVTIGDLVGYAAVKTAAKHPSHNAHLEGGVLKTFERVHMGFACDTPRGLLVPTVRNASQLSLGQFSTISKQLAAEAVEGKINPDLLAGATFTVSNLGSFGIESFTPILNAPQTAILGVSAIVPRVTLNEKGKAVAEQRIGLSLTADHRVVDGADAARFLKDLVAFIENIDLAILS